MLANIDDIYVVTNQKYKFLVMGAVEELGYEYKESNILVEPEAKNTLPAIYCAVHEIQKNTKDIVVVFPADHVIKKPKEFVDIIKNSEELAKKYIITFGIKPDSPNTGYGYISPGKKLFNGYKVKEFKEKPDIDKAKIYIDKGYFWNGGIFMFNTEVFTNELKKYANDIYEAFISSDNIKQAFSKINVELSIDYGMMEKSDIISVVPVDIGWNDLGSFDSFYDIYDKDKEGNISNDNNILIESNNNFIYSENDKLITTIGMDDMIVVDKKDALLICKKNKSQSVKDIVNILKENNDLRIEYNIEDYRPWGHYKVIEEGN